MTKRQNEAEPPKLKLLIQKDRGEDVVIEVPADWKITFGAVNPGAPPHGRDLHCLRVYEGEKLRGVFCDVRGFRDLSIPLIRKVSRETGSASWVQDSDGNMDRNERRAIEATYVQEPEPDDIPF